MTTIRFGIMGAGVIANKFCDAVNRVDGVEVVAVASKTEEKAKAFAERNGIPSYYGNYDEMLARNDIDAVYIATTHNFHVENAMQAMKAGKHVLSEKPFALNPEDAERAFEYAESHKLFLMEAMWSRFLPHINKVKQWIADGEIGTVEMATSIIGWEAAYDEKSRLFDPDLAGGSLYDVGVYPLDILQYIIPEKLIEINSTVSLAPTGVDKVAHVTMKFENCIASVFSTLTVQSSEPTVIYGTKGRIEMFTANVGNSATLYRNGKPEEKFCQPFENGFTFEVAETARCIREGLLESPVVPHSLTVATAEIFTKTLGK